MDKKYNMRYPLTTEENIPDIQIDSAIIPHIDAVTGNWVVNSIDTGVHAAGLNGAQGPKGDTGSSGETGPIGPVGPQGITGAQGNPGTNGTNGVTPHIDPTTKHWFIGTTDTNVVAEGIGHDGINGTNGADGARGPKGNPGADGISPSIDPITKHWFIGTTDTNVFAEGLQGPKGDTGATGASGATGEPGPKGDPGVNGTNGTNGKDGASLTYTTAERAVGTWIDGRPLYQRVYTYTGPVINVPADGVPVGRPDDGLQLIGSVISIEGTVVRTVADQQETYALGSADADGHVISVAYMKMVAAAHAALRLRATNLAAGATVPVVTYTVILKYVKETIVPDH